MPIGGTQDPRGHDVLDPRNSRIPPQATEPSQRELIEELVAHEDVYGLAREIAANGFDPVESLIGVDEDAKMVIVEGNRRLAALKLLTAPTLAPESHASKFKKLTVEQRLPEKVRVVIAPSRDEAAPLIKRSPLYNQDPWPKTASRDLLCGVCEEMFFVGPEGVATLTYCETGETVQSTNCLSEDESYDRFFAVRYKCAVKDPPAKLANPMPDADAAIAQDLSGHKATVRDGEDLAATQAEIERILQSFVTPLGNLAVIAERLTRRQAAMDRRPGSRQDLQTHVRDARRRRCRRHRAQTPKAKE